MTLTAFRPGALATLTFLSLAACGGAGDALDQAVGSGRSDQSSLFDYNREYIFVAPTSDGPLVVPFNFTASENGEEIERRVRGWLARGAVWDRFIDETGRTSAAAGVWRVIPHADLRVTAGGATTIESIQFESGERQLRMELESPLTDWHQGGESRFRLLRGNVAIGSETVSGPVLELLRIERTMEDGWPPGQDFDALFLSTGDTIQMLLAETLSGDGQGEGYAWIRTSSSERTWDDGEVRWLDVQANEDARRDIPIRWSFRVPGAGVVGEVAAVGFDALLGPERGGRRAVEIRYTVDGWVEIQGTRRDVVGTIRHTQQ